MNETQAERLEMRWLPVLDASGRTRMEATWVAVPATAAAQDAQVRVDAVELLPEVIAASEHFTSEVFGAAANPRLRLVAADARRFVRTTAERYDVIVADNFHPARSGSAASPAMCSTSYVARWVAVAMPRRARSRVTAKTAPTRAASSTRIATAAARLPPTRGLCPTTRRVVASRPGRWPCGAGAQ